MNAALLKMGGLVLGIAVIVALSIVSILDTKGLSEKDVKEIVEKHLLENPEIVVNSLNNYSKESRESAKAKASKIIESRAEEIYNDSQTPFAGNKDGDVVIVEFFDYACGYCKRAFEGLNELLKEDKNVKVVFKELPILSEQSTLAAKAALSVFLSNPERYFDFHQALFNKRLTSQDAILDVARAQGLDSQAIKADMNNNVTIDSLLVKNHQLATDLGIQGTPAFIIGKEFVPGFVDYDTLKLLVEKARN